MTVADTRYRVVCSTHGLLDRWGWTLFAHPQTAKNVQHDAIHNTEKHRACTRIAVQVSDNDGITWKAA